MSEWAWGFWTATAIGVFVWFSYRRSLTQPTPEPGAIMIHPEVGKEEFSRLFAGALLDKRGRDVLLGLMKASGMNWTPRESVMMKFTLGEIDKEELLREIDYFTKHNPSFHDPLVLVSQIDVLKGAQAEEEIAAPTSP
jgi:hypothetical protein